MLNILFVDGDRKRRDALADELRAYGFDLVCLGTGFDALRHNDSADVVLLNLELPDLDGSEVCRRIRLRSRVPLIGMFTRSNSMQRVVALRAGLDVCLDGDCAVPEIVARIGVVTRRSHAPDAGVRRTLSYDGLEIDAPTREVRLHGKRVGLTPKEFDLLHLLASRPGETFDRKRILATVWDDVDGWMRRSRTIDTHVNSIRRKLRGLSVIRTRRGVGFQFCRP